MARFRRGVPLFFSEDFCNICMKQFTTLSELRHWGGKLPKDLLLPGYGRFVKRSATTNYEASPAFFSTA